MTIFAKRLKVARKAAGLTQEKLGVLADIEEASASARVNQYERGKHHPDFQTVERLAKVLNVPEAYFYAKDDDLAFLALQFHRAGKKKRIQLLEAAKEPV